MHRESWYIRMILGKYGKTRQYLEHVLVLGTQWGLYSYCIVLSSVLDLLRVRSWTVWDSVFDDAGGLMLSRPGNHGTCYRGMALVSWRLISQAVRLFVQWEVSTDHSWIQYHGCCHVSLVYWPIKLLSQNGNNFSYMMASWRGNTFRIVGLYEGESNCDR